MSLTSYILSITRYRHDHREELLRKEYSLLTAQEQRLLELCHTLLERTWTKIRESEILIRTKLLMSTQKIRFKLKLVLLSQEQSKLAKLQIDIRDAKQTIHSLWGLIGVRHTSEIQAQLREILVISTNIQGRLRNDTTMLLESGHRIEDKLDQLLQTQPYSSTTEVSTRPCSPGVRSGDHPNSQRVDISVACLPHIESLERDWYKCPHRKGTKTHFDIYFGIIFLGYTNASSFRCREPDCRSGTHSSAMVVFSFPQWFSSHALALSARYSTLQGLRVSLSFQPRLSPHHEIWALIGNHQLEQITSLFKAKMLSPQARGGPTNEDLLNVSPVAKVQKSTRT